MQFPLNIVESSQTEACVEWITPDLIIREDIDYYTLSLWKEGSCATYKELNKARKGDKVFADNDISYLSTCYSLHGLEPSTIYRV